MYEVDHFPGDYLDGSWESDYYQPIYAVETHAEEYDEDYIRERDMEYSFLRRVLYDEDYNRNIPYTYNHDVYHPPVDTRDYEYDKDFWKEREIEYSFLHRVEEPTRYVFHPFIPARPYSAAYEEGTSLNPIYKSDKGKSIDTSYYASIDTIVSETRDDWPAHCYPVFALEATTHSQHVEEFNENRKGEPATDQQRVLTRDGSPSHGTLLPESIDATPSSIDRHQSKTRTE
ncbi:hypothetical protein Rs2_09892 [Raphanus sativus]|nr:hypothetical protein Rs2_09892 [Raphanus sativus]